MNRSSSLTMALLLLLAGAADAGAQGARGAAPKPAGDPAIEKQVLQASTEWADALFRNDVDAVAGLLADDFITIQLTQTGVALVEKQVQLEALRKAPNRPRVPRKLDRVRVRSYGSGVAILTAVASYEAEAATGSPGQPTQALITEVWVNTAGQWRLSHFQPTPVFRVAPRPAP